MAAHRKLGRSSDQRMAILRNQVTALIWNGRIETTAARAQEVRSIAEKLITLAVNEYDKTVTVTKQKNNDKGQTVEFEVTNDLPSKLHARRQILSVLYEVPIVRNKGEDRDDYRERTKDNKYPVVEKLFRELGPKYRARKEEHNQQGGGYTRMLKLGPRRGDGAEMVILELL